jgi:hypothetical protein
MRTYRSWTAFFWKSNWSAILRVWSFNRQSRRTFDEDAYLRGYLSQKESEWFSSNSPSKKWSEVCVHLKENNVLHGNMKKVVELLLWLPGSNTSSERMLSRLVQAILAVKTNIDLSCEAFSEKRASNPAVLKIHSSDNCHAFARTSSLK